MIYIVNVGGLCDVQKYAAAYSAVSDERRRRADSYRFAKDKNLTVGTGLLEKYLFGEEKIAAAPSGKPYLAESSGVYFNLSHSGEYVICAVGKSEIGCDIEKAAKEPDFRIAERFFTPEEYESVKKNPENFYRLWTVKESFVKAVGKGLEIPFDSFSVDFDRPKIAYNGVEYTFSETNVVFGYYCAVCMREFEPQDTKFLELGELIQ